MKIYVNITCFHAGLKSQTGVTRNYDSLELRLPSPNSPVN